MNASTNTLSPFTNFLLSPRYRVLRHACLITALIFVTLNFAMPYVEYHIFGTFQLVVFLLGVLAVYILAVYFTIHFLIPKYLLQRKYLPFVGWLSVTICMVLVIPYFMELAFCYLLGIPLYSTYHPESISIFILDVSANFFINYITFAGGSMTILLKNWLISNQKATQLEKEHLRTEVENLKEQINPGFMFQTLHFAGTLEETDPAMASDTLMKLSRMLRYQLYDCNHNFVFLLPEIRYIENYLSMEKEYMPEVSYTITTTGDVGTTLVPPLLFIPFVQFMVGKIKVRQIPAILTLEFLAGEEMVSLKCSSIPRDAHLEVLTAGVPEVEKVIRWLNILYKDNYRIGFYSMDQENIHCICLTLYTDNQ